MDVEMDKSGVGHGRGLLGHGLEITALEGRKPPSGPTCAATMMPRTWGVHAERAIAARHAPFPQARLPGSRRVHGARPQSWGITCAQTAIIPTNSVIDASAAASSTNVFSIPDSSGT